MANIIQLAAQNTAAVATGVYLTQAGALALAAPCAMKEMVSNNRRDKNGRDYLSAATKLDDTAISVQFVAVDTASMANFAGIFTNGRATINGVSVIYKSISSTSSQGGFVLFTANLIKLAPTS